MKVAAYVDFKLRGNIPYILFLNNFLLYNVLFIFLLFFFKTNSGREYGKFSTNWDENRALFFSFNANEHTRDCHWSLSIPRYMCFSLKLGRLFFYSRKGKILILLTQKSIGKKKGRMHRFRVKPN